MVFNVNSKHLVKDNMIFVNPKIVNVSNETDVDEEGCLSFPLINGDVTRHVWVEVEYQNIVGEILKQKFDGFHARVFQHEFDHLQKVH
jgi:peptide deformylase